MDLPQPAELLRVKNENSKYPTTSVARIELQRNRTPVPYCAWITSKPLTWFAINLGLQLLFVISTFLLMQLGVDVIPFKVEKLPLDIRDDVDYLRGLAWTERNEENNEVINRKFGSKNNSERVNVGDIVELYFEKSGGNVFTKTNLETIQQVENQFYENNEYQEKFCMLSAGACMKPNSILRYFDGTFAALDPILNDTEFNDIGRVLYTANNNTLLKSRVQYFLGVNAEITRSGNTYTATSDITRLHLIIGSPLPGYANASDGKSEQKDKREDFIKNHFSPLGDSYFENGVGGMTFFYGGFGVLNIAISTQIKSDMMFLTASLSFIVCFLIFQTRSFWIALFAVLGITTSFFGANLFYRFALDYRYFGTFHILSLFIILGIGADDIFVFYDTWKECAGIEFISLAHRMSHTYRKASAAMFYTSLTTAIAFGVSAASPFLGVSSFGVFSACLVIVNYFTVVTFFPTVVVLYHLYWEKKKVFCCGQNPTLRAQKTFEGSALELSLRYNRMVRFFHSTYYNWVTHIIGRSVLLVSFTGLLALFIYYASLLQVNEEEIKFLKESTNAGKFLAKVGTAFSKEGDGSPPVQLLLILGLKTQDLSACHKTDPDCKGRTVFNSNFHLKTATEQNSLLALCERLQQMSAADIADLNVRKNLITGRPEVGCFATELKSFLKVEENRTVAGFPRYPAGTNLTWPITRNDSDVIMQHVRLGIAPVYNLSAMADSFDRPFEVLMSLWLNNGFDFLSASNNAEYHYGALLGETKTIHTQKFESQAGEYLYGTRLKFAAISVNLTIDARNVGITRGLQLRGKWEDYIDTQKNTLPPALQSLYQVCVGGLKGEMNVWHFVKVQQSLVWNALTGIIVGVSCALPILIIATRNVIVGFVATLTICCTTVCVIGFIPMGGWKLGMLESLNLVLVVGLAVDYVVHLAEGYSRSLHSRRLDRVKDMLTEVGISVTSGAITTLGASFVLCFTQVLFFVQFGLFMLTTIGFSLLFSLGLFTIFMSMFGPQNTLGDIQMTYIRLRGEERSVVPAPNGQTARRRCLSGFYWIKVCTR